MKKKSRFFRELNSVFAIFCREVTLFFKSPSAVIVCFVMPAILMWMIGGNMMQNMSSGFDLGIFMLVGMCVNMLFMITTMGMSTLIDDTEINFNPELLVSPISRYSIIIGKIFGASFSAILGIFGTLIVGLCMGITMLWSQFLWLLLLSPLMCFAAGAFAMILIGSIKNKKVANYVVMLVTMPQMFLSGAIIPITNTTGALMVLSRCMPMTYCLDLMRSVIYAGTQEYASVVMFDPFINILAIVGVSAVCLAFGTFCFVKTSKNK
jgi:ABC-2 type transport system permease protein